NPEKAVQKGQNFLTTITSANENQLNTIAEIDQILTEQIWPNILAIGMLAEFYMQYLQNEYKKKNQENQLITAINNEEKKEDWILRSITDMNKVKTNQISFEQYLQDYGLRSDNDYELASPRWYETPEKIKQYIEKSVPPPTRENTNTINTNDKYIQ